MCKHRKPLLITELIFAILQKRVAYFQVSKNMSSLRLPITDMLSTACCKLLTIKRLSGEFLYILSCLSSLHGFTQIMKRDFLIKSLCVFVRFYRTWYTVRISVTPPNPFSCTNSGRIGSWRSSSVRAIESEREGWRSVPCVINTTHQSRNLR